jgi:hypothetical protein
MGSPTTQNVSTSRALRLPDIDAAKLEFLAEESNVLGEVGVLAKLSR